MADITAYLESAAVGTQVAKRTNDTGAGVVAGGYAAFINSITGDVPQVIDRSDGGIALVQTAAQNQMISNWAETQMLDSIFKRKPAGKVSYEIGPAFLPVAVKYAIPVTAAIFVAGLLVGRMLR
jgi:hypothetical protein